MERFRACLFDYGNTLVAFDRPQADAIARDFAEELGCRLGPVGSDAVRLAMAHVGSAPLRGDPPDLRERGPEEQMRSLLSLLYDGLEGAEIGHRTVGALNDVFQELFLATLALPSADRLVLEVLSRTTTLGLVSNYPCGPTLRRSLERLGLLELFATVVVSGEVGWVKPHSAPFAAALAELGARPETVLFVGDRWDADMVGASRAGMRTCHHVGLTSDANFDERYAIYRPDSIIRDLSELVGILGSEGGFS